MALCEYGVCSLVVPILATRVTCPILKSLYLKISNISTTKFQNLTVSRLVLQLSLCIILKPGVKSRMKM